VPLRTGLAAKATLTVSSEDTAVALRSGAVPVLGTPRVVALAEEATCLAVQDDLDPEQTTVGMRVQLDHLAPTGVGARVRAEAVLERIEGRRLVFTVSVSDDHGLIGAGKITRVIVETERFLKRVQ
jgi:fluoroacetyl-CoA thioesterase